MGVSVLSCAFTKFHGISLSHVQWAYFLAYYLQSTLSVPFSINLYVGSGYIPLPDSSLSGFFCPMGEYVCRAPFALSFLVILVGLLLIMRIVTIPSIVRQRISYSTIYNSLKGFFKWFYLPLLTQSLEYLFSSNDEELIPSVVLTAVLLVFPIIQLILYIVFESQKNERIAKWIEFASYFKSALFALLVVLFWKYNSTVYFFYMILLIPAYASMEMVLRTFTYPIVGRIVLGINTVIFLFIFSLFGGESSWLHKYYLDMFGLGVIILLETIYVVLEAIHFIRENRKNVTI